MATKTREQLLTERHIGGPGAFRSPWLPRFTLIAVSILILSNLVAALMVAGYQIYYDGMIYPGVTVWGVDLSGMSEEEAKAALEGRFTYPETTVITFRDSANIWPMTAGDLGVAFDIDRTVQTAYEVGRHPHLMTGLRQQAAAWQEGVVIPPVIVYDQIKAERYLAQIAAQIEQPALDASLTVQDLRATSVPGQVGRHIDMAATLEGVGRQIATLQSGEVPLVIVETQPRILNADDAAATINNMLEADMEVYIADPLLGDPGPWFASREAMADMLVVERRPTADGSADEYVLSLNEEQLYTFLEPLAPTLAHEPSSARFRWVAAGSEIEPIVASQAGRALNIPLTIAKINEVALSGGHSAPLVFDVIEPDVTESATGADLGITELVASATTYFAGSGAGRQTNIATAASRFNGLVILPEEEFSFNRYLGDVSEEEGFEKAFIIYNGRTIEGVGGGVCQVSTTVFQAAFYAGLPILERYPHGYRVSYYEVGEGAGMDATVFSPIVDFRFRNDTPYHLLIEVVFDRSRATLTFNFYSTGDGRTVQKSGPTISNIVPHGPPIYEENPAIPPGTVKKVDYAVDGADVTVYRTVYRDGQVLHQDTFYSQYVPWQEVYHVAPGYAP